MGEVSLILILALFGSAAYVALSLPLNLEESSEERNVEQRDITVDSGRSIQKRCSGMSGSCGRNLAERSAEKTKRRGGGCGCGGGGRGWASKVKRGGGGCGCGGGGGGWISKTKRTATPVWNLEKRDSIKAGKRWGGWGGGCGCGCCGCCHHCCRCCHCSSCHHCCGCCGCCGCGHGGWGHGGWGKRNAEQVIAASSTGLKDLSSESSRGLQKRWGGCGGCGCCGCGCCHHCCRCCHCSSCHHCCGCCGCGGCGGGGWGWGKKRNAKTVSLGGKMKRQGGRGCGCNHKKVQKQK